MRRRSLATLILATALGAVAPLVTSALADGGTCAPGVDACLVVNTASDGDIRDGVLTFREALMVANGQLPLADLAAGEAASVHVAAPPGLGGWVEVNFDPTLFAPGSTSVISLVPPGLGGSDSVAPPGLGGSDSVMPPGLGGSDAVLPPGLGGSDNMPPGLGGSDSIGGGVVGGQRVPVTVVVDGSDLEDTRGGLWNRTGGIIRGIRFQNFAGYAVAIPASEAAALTLDSVTFASNGTDVLVVP